MNAQTKLVAIEVATGFNYPSSFKAMIDEFSVLIETQEVRRVFCTAELLLSVAEVRAARAQMPRNLLPFMREAQPNWFDVYAFDLKSAEGRVVVWADHAIVEDWPDFLAFLEWMREQVAKYHR